MGFYEPWGFPMKEFLKDAKCLTLPGLYCIITSIIAKEQIRYALVR